MDSLQWMTDLHLLRPAWLLALFPLALCLWLYGQARARSGSWASVIDAQLLPYVLQGSSQVRRPMPLALLFILGTIVILALAGPAYEKRPQPVYKAKSALVILLDLSRSMDAADIKPSRLNRARFKVEDILKQRREGQTALIAYAADAFVVSPLTEDAETIASQLPALETDIMPSQGSRLDIALDKAHELLNNAGHNRGHIFVLTDGIDSPALKTIESLHADNIKTSILAIGTKQGAPIATRQGGFVKDNAGAIVVPRLDIAPLKQAAKLGGGKFTQLSAGDKDINTLLGQVSINPQDRSDAQTDLSGMQLNTDTWYEEGPWLLLLVIPFAAYAFRRGLVFVLLIFILPVPQPAQAFEWNQLWQNDNQRAKAALDKGEPQQAAELFKDPQWKGAAEYRAGNYQQAAELFNQFDTADAHYNRGNALAKTGQLEQALDAYNKALEQQPDHADAKHNQQLVKQALQQQQQNSQQNQDDQSSDDSQQSDSQQDSSSQSEQQNNQQQNNQSSAEDSSSAEQQSAQQNEQSAEQEQDKQQQGDAAQQQDEEAEQNEDAMAQQDDTEKAEAEDTDKQQAISKADEQATPNLDEQQTQQWLKKIPDDPGGLLRRKFQYQYSRDKKPAEDKPW